MDQNETKIVYQNETKIVYGMIVKPKII